jgi:hypothetical protein
MKGRVLPVGCGARPCQFDSRWFILPVMFGRTKETSSSPPAPPSVDRKICTDKFNGKYPHVGLYDCKEKKVWICKPMNGQAIRMSHASLITGSTDPTSTVWKDHFLCFWFYTPGSGEGYIHGYPIDWDEAHLLVRIDPNWDYDRQRLIPEELTDQVDENLERQIRHGQALLKFFENLKLKYPLSLHYIAQRAAHSLFYAKRIEATP